MNKILKRFIVITFVVLLMARVLNYLSVPRPTNSIVKDYTIGQFLTETEKKEKQELEKNNVDQLPEFDRKLYEKNIKRFSEYANQIGNYLNTYPEMRKNKELLSNYMYFSSDLGTGNFLAASMKISKIEKITGIGISL